MKDNHSTSTITMMAAPTQHKPSGILFPWRLTIHAGNPDKEYHMDFETLEDAAKALKSWHGKD